MIAMTVMQNAIYTDQRILLLTECLVLLFMFQAVPVTRGRRGDLQQGQVLGQEPHFLDEGVAEALGALDAAVIVELHAAVLAEGVPAENEQPGHVGVVVELAQAVITVHIQNKLTYLNLIYYYKETHHR